MNLQQEYKDHKILFPAGIILLLITFLWAFWPIFRDLVQTWYNNEDYSHGFFIIPVALYLVWQKKNLWQSTKPSLSWLGLVLVVCSLVALFIGILSQFRTLANISVVLAIWGSILFFFGYRFFILYGWEVFIILFMIPIPSRIYAAVTLPLQLLVTKISFFFLQLLDIPVFREGNLLHLADTSLEVVNACSGLRSILTIIIIAYILSCLRLSKNYQRFLLILFAVPLALLANLVRVVVLALFAQYGNEALIDGAGHTLLGLALFVFSFFLLLFISKGLAWVFSEK